MLSDFVEVLSLMSQVAGEARIHRWAAVSVLVEASQDADPRLVD